MKYNQGWDETIIMFIDKVAYQLERDQDQYKWVEQDLQLSNLRTLFTAVTVPESFVCDFKCRHKTEMCEDLDSRGILWEAQIGQVARQPCPGFLQGYARSVLSLGCHKDTESTTEGGQARMIASRPIRFGYCEVC